MSSFATNRAPSPCITPRIHLVWGRNETSDTLNNVKFGRIGIVGASGAVGQEYLKLIHERSWQFDELVLFGSQRSAGNIINVPGYGELEIQNLTQYELCGFDVVLFSAGANVAKQFIPEFTKHGSLCVDNSSAFRMDPSIPLIVPEINGGELHGDERTIANPNCSAIILLMALSGLMPIGNLKKVIVSTYQSSSGAGAEAMNEMLTQTQDVLDGKPANPKIFAHQSAFNVFSHDSAIEENGFNGEENKVVAESRKILGDQNLQIIPTCVRVPVLRAHTESIAATFDQPIPTLDTVREMISTAPGVQLQDDPAKNHFPMPVEASNRDDVLVGRLRIDPSDPNTILLMASGDQLRKGAALNAMQIAELMQTLG